MSKIKVDVLREPEDLPDQKVKISYGSTIASGGTLTAPDGLSVSGICTATSFVGSVGPKLARLPTMQLSVFMGINIADIGR